jgi:hypothetical protein
LAQLSGHGEAPYTELSERQLDTAARMLIRSRDLAAQTSRELEGSPRPAGPDTPADEQAENDKSGSSMHIGIAAYRGIQRLE